MPMTRALVAVGVLLTLLGGCSSKKGASTTVTTIATPGSTAAAVNPNAPELHEAGDIPDHPVFIPYSPPDKTYTVSIPQGWSQTGGGDLVSFTDKFNIIDVSVSSKAAAPTTDSVTSTDLPAIAASAGGYKAGKVSMVTRKGGPAILATYEIDSAPSSVTGKTIRVAVERYEFWKTGKSVVLTLIGAVGADNVDPWRAVTDSFTWPA